MGKLVPLCCTVGIEWYRNKKKGKVGVYFINELVIIMYVLNSNSILYNKFDTPLNMKNGFKWRSSVSLQHLSILFHDIVFIDIAIKIIYYTIRIMNHATTVDLFFSPKILHFIIIIVLLLLTVELITSYRKTYWLDICSMVMV